MPAMEEVVEAWRVSGMGRRTRVARLLEVENPRRLKSFEELYSRYL
jgi:hypothetical protein